MSTSFYKTLLKNVPASASVAVEGKSSAEFGKYIDTGSYSLNAALSGSLFGGMPDNKITVFAGPSSTGKTYFIIGVLKSWMAQNPTGVVIYFDTESAVTNQMLTDRGLDITRIIKVEPETIEQFRQSAVAILDNYDESKSPEPMIMVLDSLGNLSSSKEVQDIRDQKETRDMTKAQLIRGTFRVLRLRLAKLSVPMIVSNHVYAVPGAYVPTNALSGGCLVAGTRVILPDGSTKAIEEFKVGDEVSTAYGPCSVISTFRFTDKPVYELTLDNGDIIRCSGQHRFIVNNTWTCAEDLAINDEVAVVRNINSDEGQDALSLLLPNRE